jgi:probable HAF family extracellular repeat protein
MKTLLAVLLPLAATSPLLAQAPYLARPTSSYSIDDIGTMSPDPAHAVKPTGINNRGHVHGSNELKGYMGTPKVHSYFWDGVVQHHIYPLAPTLALPGDLNDKDQVVGYSTAGSVALHGYLWEGGGLTDIYVGLLDFSHATDISRDGWVVGTNSMMVDGEWLSQFRAYLREPGGQWVDLGTLGGVKAFGANLNERLDTVGTTSDVSGATRGFFKPFGAPMQDLGSLTGGWVVPLEVNDTGLVVGFDCDPGTGANRPVTWQGGVLTGLGTLGGANGKAGGVNSFGDVVGWSEDMSGTQRACLWREGGTPVDLGALIPSGTGWELTGAAEINDLGEICGTGVLWGNTRTYRLTPRGRVPRVSGVQPAMADRDAAVFGLGFQPGATIILVYGYAPGPSALPGCASATVDIASPIVIGTTVADSDGRIEYGLTLPSAVAGQTLRIAAVDMAGCSSSEVIMQTFN